jgi:hypothetical protein
MEPQLEEFVEAAAEVLSNRGYLVIGQDDWMPAIQVGSIVDRVAQFEMPQPFRVVAVTDPQDWIDQITAFQRLRPGWTLKDDNPTLGSRYYRVMTD